MTTSPNRAADMLIEAAAKTHDIVEWGIDSLAGSDIYCDDHIELDAIHDRLEPLKFALREFQFYSDGRPILGRAQIDTGFVFGCVWPAIPPYERGEKVVSHGRLPVDPGEPDRGGYRVHADDAACTLRVELLGPEPKLKVMP